MKLLDPDEPLFMPRGSIRALIVLASLGLFIATTIINNEPDLILAIITFAMLSLYFVSRIIEDRRRPKKPRLVDDLNVDFNK